MQISIITYLGKDSDAIVFKIKVMVMSMGVCSCSLQKIGGCGSERAPVPRESSGFCTKQKRVFTCTGEQSICQAPEQGAPVSDTEATST